MKEDKVDAVSVFLAEGQPLDFAGMVKGSALKTDENEAELMVNIARAHDRKERSYNLISRVRPVIQKKCSYHNANIKFIELPAGPPVLASIVAEIYGGSSFESRRAFASKIADILKKQDKLVDIDVLADEESYRYGLALDTNAVLNSGVKLEQLKKVLYIAFEGMEIGHVNSKSAENQIPIFLRLDDSRLLSQGSVANIERKLYTLKVMNPMGLMIPMKQFVSVKKMKQAPTITSKDLKNMISVIAETDNESQIYPLLDARSEILESLSDAYEVETTSMLNLRLTDKKTKEVFDLVWDGELKVTIDTFIDLGGAFIGALVLIYFLMVLYYHNFSLAGGIVLSSFLSLVGVIFGHYIMDLMTADPFYLTATSLIGFIGLIGINSRNSLLIIDFAKQLIHDEGYHSHRAIAIATATRAKPILLTVLAIVLASSLLATDAVFGGLGVALIGGTLFAYFVSLFFVPIVIQGPLKQYDDTGDLDSEVLHSQDEA
jgi:multidrug efflux pump subunit AcrB